ncbi:MAG: hypothetical protein NC429_03715 [Lachnospiraceae bacterium]|nr:hypothetical protein [Lachnospiraceae bacterium]
MDKIKNLNKYFILLFLILFSVFQYGIMKICGFTMYPDEFGYWASAAELAGYDWSEAASTGSYYSFGYSLILFPVLLLFKNGVFAYRTAIFINILLMLGSVLLLHKMLGILYPQLEQNLKGFLCGIGVFYPVWIFYSQMTMTEGLLFFLFILTVCLLLTFLEKKSVKTGILMAAAFVYMYCVHMRTIGILIAGSVTLFFWVLAGKKRKRYLLFWGAALLIAGSAALYLKDKTILQVFSYAEEGTLAGNDYSRQWEKIESLLGAGGIRNLIDGVVGKIFYLGISSFGTFYWAIWWCVNEIIKGIKEIKKDRRKSEQISICSWAALFLLLSVMAEILISCIFLNGTKKIDGLVYGRYNEMMVPVMIVIGLIAMMNSRFLFSGTLLSGTAAGCMMIYLLDVIEKWKLEGFRGYHAAGISYLLKERQMEEGTFNMIFFFRNTWLWGFGCMLFIAAMVWAARRKKNAAWILLGVLAVEITAGIQISEHYTYSVNRVNYGNLIISDRIREMYVEGDQIAYLDEGIPQFVDFVQMQIPEKPIHIIKISDFYGMDDEMFGFEAGVTSRMLTKEPLELPEFLITQRETKQDKVLRGWYPQKLDADTFCLYIKEKR